MIQGSCVSYEGITGQSPSSIADYGTGSTSINKPGEAAVTSRIRAARDTIRNEGEVVLIHPCEEETWQTMVNVHCKSTALSKRYQVFNDLITLSQKNNYSNIPIIESATVCERLSTYHVNRCQLLTIKHFFNTLSIRIFEWMNNVCTKVKNDCQLM